MIKNRKTILRWAAKITSCKNRSSVILLFRKKVSSLSPRRNVELINPN